MPTLLSVSRSPRRTLVLYGKGASHRQERFREHMGSDGYKEKGYLLRLLSVDQPGCPASCQGGGGLHMHRHVITTYKKSAFSNESDSSD